jgi:hypothetical protein
MHRFTWDVHYQPLDGGGRLGGPNLPIAAIGRNTIAAPTTPWVNPGQFTVKLTVNGTTYSQPIVVKPDPRVKTAALAMQQVYSLSKALYYTAIDVLAAARQARTLRDQIGARPAASTTALAESLASLSRKIEALVAAAPAGADTLTGASAGLAGVMNILQGADVPPTTLQLKAIATARTAAAAALTKWDAVRTVDLPAANAKLAAARLSPLSITP